MAYDPLAARQTKALERLALWAAVAAISLAIIAAATLGSAILLGVSASEAAEQLERLR